MKAAMIWAATVVTVIAIYLVVLSAIFYTNKRVCFESYEGLNPAYSARSGCLVTPPGAKYRIPAANFRYMEN